MALVYGRALGGLAASRFPVFARGFASRTGDEDSLEPASGSEAAADHEYVDACDENTEGIKVAILEAALAHVHAEGWSTHALSQGALDAGYSAATHGLFPRGPVELADHFVNESNLRLSSKMLMLSPDEDGTGESDFVEKALRCRLEMIIPYRETWPEALAVLMHPNNAINSMRCAGMMIDDVCYQAGDVSRDAGWYAKRAGLASVYGSTELFLLQDESPDCQDTWAFLNRRMTDLESLKHKKSDVGTVFNMAGNLAKTLVEQAVMRR